MAKGEPVVPSDSNTATINNLAIQEMLSLPRVYGPNGFNNLYNNVQNPTYGGTAGPPADLVAALEQLETATVDPALLTGDQTVASVEAQTITDLSDLAVITNNELEAAAGPGSGQDRVAAGLGEVLLPQTVASLEADAKLFTPAAAKPPVTVIDPPPPPASGVEQVLVTNVTAGVSGWENGQAYNGPVAGLQNQFITVTADNVNITATKPNNFIHTGSGNDAIDLSLFGGTGSGTNVVDGGGGSNLIAVSAFGNSVDTVFIDDRAATADTWSTVSNFHKGDAVTIYGVTPSAVTLDWEDGQGAAGFTGLTLHVIEQGKPIASLTLTGYTGVVGPTGAAGYTKADLGNGRLGVSFGNDPASGSSYLYVHATG